MPQFLNVWDGERTYIAYELGHWAASHAVLRVPFTVRQMPSERWANTYTQSRHNALQNGY